MKCICVTGAVQANVESVFTLLQQAGLDLPQLSQRNDAIDIASWHDQVSALEANQPSADNTTHNLGRFMDQMAGDIFVTNIKAALWGWADSRSTPLLDYWHDFDPRINFVLVYVSPEQMLADAIRTSTAELSVEAVMAAWQSHNQKLLRFHLRNPQRSLLIDSREALENPQALLDLCAEKWTLDLTAYIDHTNALKPEDDLLALYLAQQLCAEHTEVADLTYEIAATLNRLADVNAKISNSLPIANEDLINSYRVLQDRNAEQQQLQEQQEEIAALKDRFDERKKQDEQELKTLRADNAKNIKEFNAQLALSEESLKSCTQENELLLLQLHQVQEELEHYFLKGTELQSLLDGHIEAKATSDQEKLALIEQCDALNHELAALSQQSQLSSEQQQHIDNLIQSAENHAQHQQITESHFQASTQENELLLLQLHQVQEELEHYFLQHQDKQNALKLEEIRWQRMLQRNPDYCDYESLKLLPEESGHDNALAWQFKNLYIASRSIPQLTFQTFTEQGLTGFVFSESTSKENIFTRWPLNSLNEDQLTLIPCGEGELIVKRFETLINLSTSDWAFLQALIRMLLSILQQPQTLNLPTDVNVETYLEGLIAFQNIINKFPPILRYDQLTLKRSQVNPDYEHLWLNLDNLSFGDKHLPAFNFRLSCANVGPNRFGGYPKLEFPETTESCIFEGWFIESYDDFGGKLELRFALPKAMDIEVWQRLSDNDRDFLFALLMSLPNMLGILQNSTTQIKRPWADWLNMIKDMQAILEQQRTPKALVSAEPEPIAAIQANVEPIKVAPKKPVKKPAPATSKRTATTKTVTVK
jgi:hypothetical protein